MPTSPQDVANIPLTFNVLNHLLTFQREKGEILFGTQTITNQLAYIHARLLYTEDNVSPINGAPYKSFTFNDTTSCYTTTIVDVVVTSSSEDLESTTKNNLADYSVGTLFSLVFRIGDTSTDHGKASPWDFITLERIEYVTEQYGVDADNKPLPILPLITQQTTQEWQPTPHYKAASDYYATHCLKNKDDVNIYDPLIVLYSTFRLGMWVNSTMGGLDRPSPQRVVFEDVDITGRVVVAFKFSWKKMPKFPEDQNAVSVTDCEARKWPFGHSLAKAPVFGSARFYDNHNEFSFTATENAPHIQQQIKQQHQVSPLPPTADNNKGVIFYQQFCVATNGCNQLRLYPGAQSWFECEKSEQDAAHAAQLEQRQATKAFLKKAPKVHASWNKISAFVMTFNVARYHLVQDVRVKNMFLLGHNPVVGKTLRSFARLMSVHGNFSVWNDGTGEFVLDHTTTTFATREVTSNLAKSVRTIKDWDRKKKQGLPTGRKFKRTKATETTREETPNGNNLPAIGSWCYVKYHMVFDENNNNDNNDNSNTGTQQQAATTANTAQIAPQLLPTTPSTAAHIKWKLSHINLLYEEQCNEVWMSAQMFWDECSKYYAGHCIPCRNPGQVTACNARRDLLYAQRHNTTQYDFDPDLFTSHQPQQHWYSTQFDPALMSKVMTAHKEQLAMNKTLLARNNAIEADVMVVVDQEQQKQQDKQQQQPQLTAMDYLILYYKYWNEYELRQLTTVPHCHVDTLTPFDFIVDPKDQHVSLSSYPLKYGLQLYDTEQVGAVSNEHDLVEYKDAKNTVSTTTAPIHTDQQERNIEKIWSDPVIQKGRHLQYNTPQHVYALKISGRDFTNRLVLRGKDLGNNIKHFSISMLHMDPQLQVATCTDPYFEMAVEPSDTHRLLKMMTGKDVDGFFQHNKIVAQEFPSTTKTWIDTFWAYNPVLATHRPPVPTTLNVLRFGLKCGDFRYNFFQPNINQQNPAFKRANVIHLGGLVVSDATFVVLAHVQRVVVQDDTNDSVVALHVHDGTDGVEFTMPATNAPKQGDVVVVTLELNYDPNYNYPTLVVISCLPMSADFNHTTAQQYKQQVLTTPDNKYNLHDKAYRTIHLFQHFAPILVKDWTNVCKTFYTTFCALPTDDIAGFTTPYDFIPTEPQRVDDNNGKDVFALPQNEFNVLPAPPRFALTTTPGIYRQVGAVVDGARVLETTTIHPHNQRIFFPPQHLPRFFPALTSRIPMTTATTTSGSSVRPTISWQQIDGFVEYKSLTMKQPQIQQQQATIITPQHLPTVDITHRLTRTSTGDVVMVLPPQDVNIPTLATITTATTFSSAPEQQQQLAFLPSQPNLALRTRWQTPFSTSCSAPLPTTTRALNFGGLIDNPCFEGHAASLAHAGGFSRVASVYGVLHRIARTTKHTTRRANDETKTTPQHLDNDWVFILKDATNDYEIAATMAPRNAEYPLSCVVLFAMRPNVKQNVLTPQQQEQQELGVDNNDDVPSQLSVTHPFPRTTTTWDYVPYFILPTKNNNNNNDNNKHPEGENKATLAPFYKHLSNAFRTHFLTHHHTHNHTNAADAKAFTTLTNPYYPVHLKELPSTTADVGDEQEEKEKEGTTTDVWKHDQLNNQVVYHKLPLARYPTMWYDQDDRLCGGGAMLQQIMNNNNNNNNKENVSIDLHTQISSQDSTHQELEHILYQYFPRVDYMEPERRAVYEEQRIEMYYELFDEAAYLQYQ